MLAAVNGRKRREDAREAAIRVASETLDLGELGAQAIPLLKLALDAPFAAMVAFDGGDGPLGCAGDLDVCAPELYYSTFAGDDPMQAAIRRWHPRVFVGARHVEHHALERTAVYHDYYRPRDLGPVLAARLGADRYFLPGSALMVFFRATSQDGFDRRDARALLKVLPALDGAVRRGHRAAAQRLAGDAVAALAGSDGRARLACSPRGEVLWISPAADVKLGGKRPPEALLDGIRRFAAAGTRAGGASDPASSSVSLPRLRAELHLERTAGGETFVVAELVPMPLEPLTTAEAHVLAALREGLSNAEIARRLLISVPTVKTHVHHVLAKLGVSSRLQAATLR